MPKRRPDSSSVGIHLSYVLYRLFASFVARLPRRIVLLFSEALGALVYHLDSRRRRIALDNLSRAFGRSLSHEGRRRTARRSMMNFVRSLFDILKTAPWPPGRVEALIDVQGKENLETALARGRGVLLFTAHFGNWEMVITPIARRVPFHVIVRALDNPLIDRELESVRARRGATVLNKFGAGRPVLRALGRKGAVGIVIDQNVLRREAVFVDFFGIPAATTPALAVFHLRTGAPIVPMFCVPAPGDRYRLIFGPPVDLPLTGDEAVDVLKITAVCTKMIEAAVRRDPDSWLWIHKRWQSRPHDEKS
ncbi:MAG TPA: lysophospholipid acyltransferase family protein [Candidatus Aminicenantes bacterium]|nr:lysophospholipid acyltransferase family protein [Candidatus Aminicenantes bacterium]HNT31264.1 lysophospholipid acyltransferase family protein [Candidatus Aminicenantes bacterium]